MTIRRASVLSLAALLVTVSHVAIASERPNVLVIAIDDLRDYLGCYGADFVHSPNIDRLARRGVLFERAYCQMAVCGPSRSSVFSGARPDTLRAFNNKTHFRTHRPGIVSLPEHFKAHGYRTQGIGKILHNTHRDPRSWTVPSVYPMDPQYALPVNRGKRALIDGFHEANRENPLVEAADVDDEGYRDGVIAATAVDAIQQLASGDRPFLLMVGFHKPHSPFNAPQKYWDLYERSQIPLAPNPFPPAGSPACSTAPVRYLRSFANMPSEGRLPESVAREITHAYLACVSYIDAQVGKLITAIERHGLTGNTIVFLWSDHGYQLGHHTLWCKHSNFEAATRVPLIVVDPRVPASNASRCTAPVELLDIYPTLADLAGLKIPTHCEGRSLKAAVEEPGAFDQRHSVAFSQFNKAGYRGRSMRTRRYRITQWKHSRTSETLYEVFDHDVDPQENRNVGSDPSYREVVARLTAELTTHWPRPPSE